LPDLRESWLQLVQQVQGRLDVAARQYDIMAAVYSGSYRYYHNLEHVGYCLRLLTEVEQPLLYRDAMELAIWFHDLVYLPGFPYNEELSSAVAHSFILELTGNHLLAEKARELIMVTKHDRALTAADSLEAQYMADIDLAVLGESFERYAYYERAIRQEYGYLSDEQYCYGRRQVLTGLLNRPYIYATLKFRQKFEAAARRNILHTMAQMEQVNNLC